MLSDSSPKSTLNFTLADVAAADPLKPLAVIVEFLYAVGGEICTDEHFADDMAARGVELDHAMAALKYLQRVGWVGYDEGPLYDGHHEAAHVWIIDGGAREREYQILASNEEVGF